MNKTFSSDSTFQTPIPTQSSSTNATKTDRSHINRGIHIRKPLPFKEELLLLLLPVFTIVTGLFFFIIITNQQAFVLIFSSGILFQYITPYSKATSTSSILIANIGALLIGLLVVSTIGSGNGAIAIAVVSLLLYMQLLDSIYPPALSLTMLLCFRIGFESTLTLAGIATLLTVSLVIFNQIFLKILDRVSPPKK